MHNFHVQIEAKNGKLIPLPLHQQRHSTKKKEMVCHNSIYCNFSQTSLSTQKTRQVFLSLIACNMQFQYFLWPKQGGQGRPLGPSPRSATDIHIPPQKGLKFPRGRGEGGLCKTKKFKEMNVAQLKFSDGLGGGCSKKSLLWRQPCSQYYGPFPLLGGTSGKDPGNDVAVEEV